MSVFRCLTCGFSLPASSEHDAKNGRGFLCEPLTEEEGRIMERELSPRRGALRGRMRDRYEGAPS